MRAGKDVAASSTPARWSSLPFRAALKHVRIFLSEFIYLNPPEQYR
jgi:hypothetical protein